MTDKDQLKPCPFCGSKNLSLKKGFTKPPDGCTAAVVCNTCQARGPEAKIPADEEINNDYRKAYRDWNMRR